MLGPAPRSQLAAAGAAGAFAGLRLHRAVTCSTVDSAPLPSSPPRLPQQRGSRLHSRLSSMSTGGGSDGESVQGSMSAEGAQAREHMFALMLGCFERNVLLSESGRVGGPLLVRPSNSPALPPTRSQLTSQSSRSSSSFTRARCTRRS